MTALAKKVFELFGKPELVTEQPAAPVYPTSEPRPFYDDAREDEPEAVRWLRSRLTTGPQHIADLFSEWCADVVGHPSHEISARMDLLNDARWALDVHPYIGADDRFWWRLPQKLEQ
jgi:hypothetical protein